MNKQMDFERWAPPKLDEKQLQTIAQRQQKRRIVNLLSVVLSVNLLAAMLLVLKVASVNPQSGWIGFCSIGVMLVIIVGVLTLLLYKRRDYFYD